MFYIGSASSIKSFNSVTRDGYIAKPVKPFSLCFVIRQTERIYHLELYVGWNIRIGFHGKVFDFGSCEQLWWGDGHDF